MDSINGGAPGVVPAAEAPDVTIVIPLHDGARFIRETLRSVVDQTFRHFEVVVVDDGSSDGGPDLMRADVADPRVRIVSNPGRGVATARNEGAARASGSSRYLVFLDADDVWKPGTLATLLAAIEGRPDAAGAFALAEYIDGDGRVMNPGDFPRHMRGREDLSDGRLVPRDSTAELEPEHLFIANLVYPPSCLLLRRTAFDAVGGFDPRFLAEDWEFVLRVARHGPIFPVDRVMVGYRRHAANASGNRARNVHGARQIWAAAYHSPENSPDTVARLRARWRAHQSRTAARKVAEARGLLRQGRVLPALRRATDGAAHALLRHPPRIWISLGARRRAGERRASARTAEGGTA